MGEEDWTGTNAFHESITVCTRSLWGFRLSSRLESSRKKAGIGASPARMKFSSLQRRTSFVVATQRKRDLNYMRARQTFIPLNPTPGCVPTIC